MVSDLALCSKAVQGAKYLASAEECIEQGEKHFYPAKKFSVKNYLFSKGVSLNFPDCLYISRNYCDLSWVDYFDDGLCFVKGSTSLLHKK